MHTVPSGHGPGKLPVSSFSPTAGEHRPRPLLRWFVPARRDPDRAAMRKPPAPSSRQSAKAPSGRQRALGGGAARIMNFRFDSARKKAVADAVAAGAAEHV